MSRYVDPDWEDPNYVAKVASNRDLPGNLLDEGNLRPNDFDSLIGKAHMFDSSAR